jgi:hypothetical protein
MFVRSLVWISDRAIDYMYWPVNIAFAACIFIFAPLSLFRRTRAFSAGGFLVSSFVFGACTWLAGVLATYDYLGAVWVFIGLAVIGVGIVPIGIVGAMIHSDWLAAGLLFGSLVMTFGTRLIGAAIGAWSEKH